jgi:hypothetical protein
LRQEPEGAGPRADRPRGRRRHGRGVDLEAGFSEGDEPPLAVGVGIEAVLARSPADVVEEAAVDAYELRVVGRVI